MQAEQRVPPSDSVLRTPGAVFRFHRANVEHPAMSVLCDLAAARDRDLTNPGRHEEHPQGLQPPVHVPDMRMDPVEVVAGEIRLQALPRIIFELQRLIDDPASTPDDLAKVVSLDPGLSVYLLRVVNSALYRLPSRIDTVSRAIFVLGTRRLSMLAMGASALKALAARPIPGLDLEDFWGHSVACAIVARGLAILAGRKAVERFFISGLLHDLGVLALHTSRAAAAKGVRAVMASEGLLLTEAEQRILGFDHARLGAILLRKWNFPFCLAKAVLYHHAPMSVPAQAEADSDEPAIVHVADVICCALGYGHAPECLVPPLDDGAWDSLELSPDCLPKMAAELRSCFAETLATFGPQTGD